MTMSGPPLQGDARDELVALIEHLHETERRVETLTAGEVDSVSDRDGHPLLLRRAQDRMRLSDAVKEAAILNALPARIALLDLHGTIVSANGTWLEHVDAHPLQGPGHAVGVNYVERLEAAAGRDAEASRQVARGILDVIENRRSRFTLEFEADAAACRWCLLSVSPLDDDRLNGVVVMQVDVSEQRRADQAIRRFAGAMEAIADGIFLVDRASMRFIHVNDAACRMHHCGRDELLALEPWTVLRVSREALQDAYDEMIASGVDARPFDLLDDRDEGSPRMIEIRRHAERSAGSWTIVTLARDVTEKRAVAESIVRLSRVHAMLGGINALAMHVRDRDALFAEACRIAVQAGGFPMAWIAIVEAGVPRPLGFASNGVDDALMSTVRDSLAASAAFQRTGGLTMQAINERKAVFSNDIANDPRLTNVVEHTKAGIRSIALLPLIVGGDAVGVFALYAFKVDFFHPEEMTLLAELADNVAFAIDHLDKQERLTYLAYYDPLTGLANRSLFLERVGQHMRAAAGEGHALALFLVNLVRFKGINDSLGQAAGDSILRQVADCLSGIAGGSALTARLGGDQFAVVLPHVREGGDLSRLVDQVMARLLQHPFRVGDAAFRISMRIGAAVFPNDALGADALFRKAEAALKRTRATGDPYLFYTATMTATDASRLTLENQLRRALENDEFVLHYQPKVSLATGRIVGAEALIRWNEREAGLVPPGHFIPMLEETGLIKPVGRWVLERAIADYLGWLDAGLPAVRVAVNVSPLQLRSGTFVAEVTKAIGIDPRAAAGLELEITESVIVEDVTHNVESLNELRALGIRVAIDDFGTGFSSLSYLSHLPLDTLKIDRSFVTELTATAEGQALVSTIISLAHALHLEVVAEGVETQAQERLLRLLHCDEMQGYLFSQPVPRDVFESRFLRAGPRHDH